MEIWDRTQDVIKGAMKNAGHHCCRSSPPSVSPTNAKPPLSGIKIQVNPITTPSSGKIPAQTKSSKIWKAASAKIASAIKLALPLATYFSGPKVMWMLENVEGLREAAEKGDAIFGNMDTWIIWNLTGWRQMVVPTLLT